MFESIRKKLEQKREVYRLTQEIKKAGERWKVEDEVLGYLRSQRVFSSIRNYLNTEFPSSQCAQKYEMDEQDFNRMLFDVLHATKKTINLVPRPPKLYRGYCISYPQPDEFDPNVAVSRMQKLLNDTSIVIMLIRAVNFGHIDIEKRRQAFIDRRLDAILERQKIATRPNALTPSATERTNG